MFDLGTMTVNIAALPTKIESAAVKYAETVGADMQAQAQENRPWTDRTAQARQRLKYYVQRTDKGVRIYLAHGVNYGVSLEFKHEKRYAIVYPTLRKNAPSVMKGLERLFGGRL